MDRGAVETLRLALTDERASLRAQLEEHGADPDEEALLDVELEGGFSDSAQATAERARLIALVEGLRRNLADVERALGKIESGTDYGRCERCGREIAPERLEAIPWAALCIDCKQKVR